MNDNNDLKEKLYIQANVLALQQNYAKAIDLYSEILALDSNFADAILSRALTYEALGNINAALTDYKKAVNILQEKLHNANELAFSAINTLQETATKNPAEVSINKAEIKKSEKQPIARKKDLHMCTEHEKKLYRYIVRYKKASSAQASKILGLQKSRTTDVINALIKQELISKQGQGRATYYIIS